MEAPYVTCHMSQAVSFQRTDMSRPVAPQSLEDLNKFQFDRILNEDPLNHSLALLGSFPSQSGQQRVQAIVRLERTALSAANASHFFNINGQFRKVQLEESTDIVRKLGLFSA